MRRLFRLGPRGGAGGAGGRGAAAARGDAQGRPGDGRPDRRHDQPRSRPRRSSSPAAEAHAQIYDRLVTYPVDDVSKLAGPRRRELERSPTTASR